MDAVTAAISLVQNELEKLKKVFDKSCEERKKSLKNLCEACENNPITIDHPIKGEPVIDVIIDGVEKMQLNMAFLCQDCFDKLSAADKI